ncbi:MAG: ribonuclease III [Deltaproteobacteria bacterium]|nr:MAG: ribonuclease III [Deltaproteobacteria bacterium]
MAAVIESLVQKNKEMLAGLEQTLGYRFTNLLLLQQALVHSSYAFERSAPQFNNETLEFLGDAVLDLVIGHLLYRHCPDMREGELTRLRAALVNETHLARMARKIKLGDYLFLGKGEEASSGREKSSILSCAYEAVIGAVFEDGGYDSVCRLVETFFIPAIDAQKDELLVGDAKSRLQEKLQGRFNETPVYVLDKEEGPPHQKLFTASVIFRGERLGTGQAGSRKKAEQQAAAFALKKYENQ